MKRLPDVYPETDELVLKGSFMSDAAYAEAMDSMVIVCTDVVIVDPDSETIMLVKRKAKPMKGWWWIGGRVRKGEPFVIAAARNFKRETGLDIALERFVYVMDSRYFWKDRQQEPQDAGSDNLAYTFSVELTADELEQIVLDPNEYEQEAGLTKFDFLALKAPDIHPVIRTFFNTIFP
jgi:ADP-ribose pyrophosphatase YjhB (NUDIX family)